MAANLPSIKGSAISSLIEDVSKLVDAEQIDAGLLERHLEDPDRALLGRPVSPAAWYPMDSYRRLSELLCELEGRGPDLLRERGAAAAARLGQAGIYQQMETVQRMRAERTSGGTSFAAYGRDLRLIVTLSGSMMSVGSWKVEVDPDSGDRYRIVVNDAAAFPDVLVWSSEGFINRMADPRGDVLKKPAWRASRPALDTVLYRMTRPA